MRAMEKRRTPFSGLLSAAAYKPLALRTIYFLCGLLVSRGAIYSEYVPFGVSLAAAAPYENALSAALGAALGYILLMKGECFRCVASVVTVFALRWLFSDLPKIHSSVVFAPLIAAAPLMCTGIVMTIATGRSKGELVMSVLEAMLAGVGAYFLSEAAALAAGRRGITTFNQQETACIVMTCCIFLLSANSIAIGGVSVGRILAVTAVLYCAYYGAVSGGCIGGTAAGVVFGLGSEGFGFLALGYSFGGLMAGLFSYIGKIGAAAAFVLCSTVVSLSVGVTKQTAAVFYETAAASLIFLFIPNEVSGRIAMFVTPHSSSGDSDSLRRGVIMRLDMASKAIAGINDAVSTVAYKLGQRYSNELESVFSRSIEESCSRCGMRAFCEKDGEDIHRERLMSLAPLLKSAGEVDEDDVKRILVRKCCRSREMAAAINANYSAYLGYLSAKARSAQIRGVVAGQFAGLSEILSGLKSEFERYETYDQAAAEKICAALKVSGIVPLECSVRTDTFGRMTVEIETPLEDKRLLRKGDITAEISRLCGRRMQQPVVSSAGNRARITLSERTRLDIQVGTAQHVCGSGRLCGDSFNYFNDGQGRFITVISDGMGTGGRAAVDGGMAVSIISKLVKAGLGFDAALSAANSALMVKSEDESLATADILCLDLFTGEAQIMKAGAPVTFMRKSGKVIRIEPSSLPAGILGDISLTHDEEELDEGDLIVMVTDGAISISDEWIGAMMRDFEGADVQELVNDIIDEAMIGSTISRDDDITVVGIRVLSS